MDKKELLDNEKILRYAERLLWQDYDLKSEAEQQNEMEISEQLRLMEEDLLSRPQNEWVDAGKELADQGVLVGLFFDACREAHYDARLWEQLKESTLKLIENHKATVDRSGWTDEEILQCAKDMLEPFNEAMLTFHFLAAMGIQYGDLEPIFADLLKEWFECRAKNYTLGF